MQKAAVGKAVGVERMLAISAAVVVVMVITLAALFLTAAPSTAPAPSGTIGENAPVMGSGGAHYGERWNDYGHASDAPLTGSGGAHYGQGWDNYGHTSD